MNAIDNEEILKAKTANNARSQTRFKTILSGWNVYGQDVISFFRSELLRFKVQKIEHSREIEDVEPTVGKDSVKEKAYQRAFYNNQAVVKRSLAIPELKVTWIDMEIPVARKPSLKFDLIGQDGRDLLLAELKGPGGESPFYALLEALRYAHCIKENRQTGFPYRKSAGNYWLSSKKLKHLIIAGPVETYWGKQVMDKNSWWEHRKKLKQIVTELKKTGECQFDIIFAHFPDEDFVSQAAMAGGAFKPACRIPIIWQELPD